MKKYIAFLLLILILAACGPAPAPTLNAADAQSTAVAQAWLVVTLTQYAIPTATATPLPPTAPPIPTATLLPTLPPLQPTPTPASPTADPCNGIPPKEPKGTTVQVRFLNKTEGVLNLAFGMYKPNELGECGTYSYTLSRYDTPVVTVLAGCYWGTAWVDTPSVAKAPDPLCVTDTTKTVDIWITAEVIYFH